MKYIICMPGFVILPRRCSVFNQRPWTDHTEHFSGQFKYLRLVTVSNFLNFYFFISLDYKLPYLIWVSYLKIIINCWNVEIDNQVNRSKSIEKISRSMATFLNNAFWYFLVAIHERCNPKEEESDFGWILNHNWCVREGKWSYVTNGWPYECNNQ